PTLFRSKAGIVWPGLGGRKIDQALDDLLAGEGLPLHVLGYDGLNEPEDNVIAGLGHGLAQAIMAIAQLRRDHRDGGENGDETGRQGPVEAGPDQCRGRGDEDRDEGEAVDAYKTRGLHHLAIGGEGVAEKIEGEA